MRTRSWFIVILLPLLSVSDGLVIRAGDLTGNTCRTVDEVLERFIEAAGGRKAIHQLRCRICKGHLIDNMPSRTPPVYRLTPYEAMAKIPDRVIEVTHSPEGMKGSGFDGAVGWNWKGDSVWVDERAGKTKMAWLLNPQSALHVQDYFPGLSMKPIQKTGDHTVYALEPAELPKEYFTLYFDVETGLPIQIGYYWQLQDYREVDGAQFPFRIVCSRKGGSTTYLFDEVKHNVVLDDSLFAMPVLDAR